jgi:hypothetical protein
MNTQPSMENVALALAGKPSPEVASLEIFEFNSRFGLILIALGDAL